MDAVARLPGVRNDLGRAGPRRRPAPARALMLLDQREPLHCVWSGRRLEAGRLDIDHCLPWSAWSCGDLWNLLPAHPEVN